MITPKADHVRPGTRAWCGICAGGSNPRLYRDHRRRCVDDRSPIAAGTPHGPGDTIVHHRRPGYDCANLIRPAHRDAQGAPHSAVRRPKPGTWRHRIYRYRSAAIRAALSIWHYGSSSLLSPN